MTIKGKANTVKRIIWTATVASGLLAFGGLLIGGFQILPYCLAYSHYLGILTKQAGLNPWLAKALTLVLVIPLAYGVRLIFAWRKRRRNLGWGLIIGYLVAFNLLMFGFTRSDYFDRAQGKAAKHYALTPEGYRFFNSPGFDPKYGIALSPVTPEVAAWAENPTVHPGQYFDPLTGRPLAWYAKRSAGIELYPLPGFDPQTGRQLRPVTKEIVEEYEQAPPEAAAHPDPSTPLTSETPPTASASIPVLLSERHVIELHGDMPDPADGWAGYAGLLFDPQKGEYLRIRTTTGVWYHPSLKNEFYIPPHQERQIRFRSFSGLYLFSKDTGNAEITAFRPARPSRVSLR